VRYGTVSVELCNSVRHGKVVLFYRRNHEGRSVWVQVGEDDRYPQRCPEGGSLSDSVAAALGEAREFLFDDVEDSRFFAGYLIGSLDATPEENH
jgi:hypothetical protein